MGVRTHLYTTDPIIDITVHRCQATLIYNWSIQWLHNNKTGRLTLRKTGSPKSLKLGDVAVRWMGCWTVSMATHSTICAGETKNIFTTHTYMILRHIFSHNRFFLSSVINTDYRSSLHSSKWFFVASISRFRNQERWVKRKIYFSGRGVD